MLRTAPGARVAVDRSACRPPHTSLAWQRPPAAPELPELAAARQPDHMEFWTLTCLLELPALAVCYRMTAWLQLQAWPLAVLGVMVELMWPVVPSDEHRPRRWNRVAAGQCDMQAWLRRPTRAAASHNPRPGQSSHGVRAPQLQLRASWPLDQRAWRRSRAAHVLGVLPDQPKIRAEQTALNLALVDLRCGRAANQDYMAAYRLASFRHH